MRGERELVNGVRSVMGPANPVPAGAYEGDTTYLADLADRVTALRSAAVSHDRRGSSTWRLVAPALSGLAVVAVVVSLTLAAGQGPAARRSTGGASAVTSLPRFYVTVN